MDDMDDIKENIEKMAADLKMQFEELQLQAGLAKLEAIDEWRELQPKLRQFETKAKDLSEATAEASKEIGAAAKLLGEEILDGIKHVAKRF
jgi:chromosome segregation ATPase